MAPLVCTFLGKEMKQRRQEADSHSRSCIRLNLMPKLNKLQPVKCSSLRRRISLNHNNSKLLLKAPLRQPERKTATSNRQQLNKNSWLLQRRFNSNSKLLCVKVRCSNKSSIRSSNSSNNNRCSSNSSTSRCWRVSSRP